MAKGATLPQPRLQLNDAEKKQYVELRQKPAEAGPTAVEPPLDKLSTEDQKAELWAIVQPFLPIAVGSELDSSQEEIAVWYSAKKISTTPLGDIPLVVISRGEGGYPDTPEVSGKQLDQERREEQAGPQRPQPFIFQFEPQTETFKFRIQFKKSHVSRDELISTLREILSQLEDTSTAADSTAA